MKIRRGCVDRSAALTFQDPVLSATFTISKAKDVKIKWDSKSAFMILLVLQTLYTGVTSQCKTYANSNGNHNQNQTQPSAPSNNYGQCISCDKGYSLQKGECIPDSQSFDLTELPGVILVVSVGSCILFCLAFHFIQKKCKKKEKNLTQGTTAVETPSVPLRNTLSHQQWSWRMSKISAFKVFTASERSRKLQELTRQPIPLPIVPYQVHQTTIDQLLVSDGGPPVEVQSSDTANPTIQGIQFLDVGQPCERPQLNPLDDVMIVLGNPPTREIGVIEDKVDAAVLKIHDDEKLLLKIQHAEEKSPPNDEIQDNTKLASDFTRISSNFMSGFGQARLDLPTIGIEDNLGDIKRESWKAEEA